jgi:hypothetical protein
MSDSILDPDTIAEFGRNRIALFAWLDQTKMAECVHAELDQGLLDATTLEDLDNVELVIRCIAAKNEKRDAA